MIEALHSFSPKNNNSIQKATLTLLNKLGIELDVPLTDPRPVSDVLENPSLAVRAIINKIQDFYLVGLVNDNTFLQKTKENAYEVLKQMDDRYEGMMVFAVDIQRAMRITRSEMATLTRAFNRVSHMAPVMVVFRYYIDEKVNGRKSDEKCKVALSLCERSAYKRSNMTGEKAGKVNILRDIRVDIESTPHTGQMRILEAMRLSEKEDYSYEGAYKKWLDAFNNDVLTNKFYEELKNWYFWAIKNVSFPNDVNNDKDNKKYNPENVIRLITRLIFAWFLMQKGLIPKNIFGERYLKEYLKDFNPHDKSSSYYHAILQNLFFATLNKKIEERAFVSKQEDDGIKTLFHYADHLAISQEAFIDLLRGVPYMNNSLFECLDNKRKGEKTFSWDGFSDIEDKEYQASVPNYLFFAKERTVDFSEEFGRKAAEYTKVNGLIEILSHYTFTVEENTPLDVDVALDPELLGKVFENLLAAYNPETGETVRKSTGSYYTPRPIVEYMVNESLVAYLHKQVPEVAEDVLRSLLDYSDEDRDYGLSAKDAERLVSAIFKCKVLDPACGSGAFPMGILQQMSHFLGKVDKDNQLWLKVVMAEAKEKNLQKDELERINLSFKFPNYARKLYLIENCVYGVDIQTIATQISRLRFFISLVCEQTPNDKAEDNYGVHPLPNLEMKFVSANTLVKLESVEQTHMLFRQENVMHLIDQLKDVRHRLFVVTDNATKKKLREEDEVLRSKITLEVGNCFTANCQQLISDLQAAIRKHEKALTVAQGEDDRIVTTTVGDLFGGTGKTVSYSLKEKKIKEIKAAIADAQKKIRWLSEGSDERTKKIMDMAKQLTDWNPFDQNVSSGFFDPEWMFDVATGFDVVIGNPPYINVENLDEDLKEIMFENFQTCQGRTDIYIAFVEKAIDLLNNTGVCSYIIPYPYTNQNYATLSREMLVEKYSVQEIVDTSDYNVFESAQVRNIIIRFGKEKGNTTLIKKVSSAIDFANADFKTREIETDKFKLLKNCRFETKDFLSVLELKRKIEADTIPFGKICLVAYGVRVNHKTDKSKPKSYYIYGDNPDGYLMPFTEGRNIDRYAYSLSGYLDYCPDEHYNPMFPELFENEKLFFINVVSDRIRFAYDDQNVYNSHTVVNCVRIDKLKKAKHISARKALKQMADNVADFETKFLLAVVNSKLINWYFLQFLSEGLHFYPDDAKALPIIQATPAQQKRIIELADEVLSAKQEDPKADTTAEEREIDLLVYKLYGLTYDEVKVVDTETDITEEEYNG